MTNKKTLSSIASAKEGFTLMEIMVVVSIVTVAFVSIIGLVQRAITLYYNNKNVMVANNLAQEGLELVRYVRDDNWKIPATYGGQVADNYFARNISVDGIDEIPAKDTTNGTDTKLQMQEAGNIMIFSIDPRVLKDGLDYRGSIRPFYRSNPLKNKTANPQSLETCDGIIRTCLKLPQAKLYRDNTDPNNVINRFLNSTYIDSGTNKRVYQDTNETPSYVYTGFNRLIFTEYRDGGEAGTTADDYLHVESWVYWSDHGSDKYFHLDTDLYDYSWRK